MNSEVLSQTPRTLIIMPAWNEEEVIGGTIEELFRMMPEVDLVVVNDGSTDRTSEIARAAGAFVIDLPYNMGIGGALRTGYKYARQVRSSPMPLLVSVQQIARRLSSIASICLRSIWVTVLMPV